MCADGFNVLKLARDLKIFSLDRSGSGPLPLHISSVETRVQRIFNDSETNGVSVRV